MATEGRSVGTVESFPSHPEVVMFTVCERFAHKASHGLCTSRICALDFLSSNGVNVEGVA